MIGEDLTPQRFKDYRVFIQSTGSGKRFIPKDGMVLYKVYFKASQIISYRIYHVIVICSIFFKCMNIHQFKLMHQHLH